MDKKAHLKLISGFLCGVFCFAKAEAQEMSQAQAFEKSALNGPVKKVILTEYKVRHKFDSIIKGEHRGWTTYHFNKDKKLTRKTLYYSDGSHDRTLVFSYNEKGRRTQARVRDSVGNFQGNVSFNYHPRERVREKKRFKLGGGLEFQNVLHYDTNGHKSNRVIYGSNGELVTRTFYAYNERGLIRRKKVFFDNGSILSNELFVYKRFDARNNWIKRVARHDEMPLYIEERTIRYYGEQ